LEVLDPVHDATVTTARYTFSGVTDPGCTVTVGGRYEATVAEDGTWSLELNLEPGQNSTTFVATHPETGLETSTAIRVYHAGRVELRADGLGAVSFGEDETTTMAILTGLLGPPVFNSTCNDSWYCSGTGYGLCRYIRETEWPDENFTIAIADCEGNADQPETPELIAWTVRDVWGEGGGSTLRTPEGVSPGSTLGELQAAYGDRLVVGNDECGWGLQFWVAGPSGVELGGLRGGLKEPPGLDLNSYDGTSTDLMMLLGPNTLVTGLEAGFVQNC
jgi:hypothetical protein